MDELINQPFYITPADLMIKRCFVKYLLFVFKGNKYIQLAEIDTITPTGFRAFNYDFGKLTEVFYSFDEVRKGIEVYKTVHNI